MLSIGLSLLFYICFPQFDSRKNHAIDSYDAFQNSLVVTVPKLHWMKSYMILSRYFIQFTVVDIPVLISSMWLSASTPSMPIAWEQGYHQEYWTKYQTSEPCEVWPPWICINIIKNNIDIHTVIVWFKALPQLMLNRERGKGWKNPDTIPMPTKCDFPVSKIKQLIVTTWLYYGCMYSPLPMRQHKC